MTLAEVSSFALNRTKLIFSPDSHLAKGNDNLEWTWGNKRKDQRAKGCYPYSAPPPPQNPLRAHLSPLDSASNDKDKMLVLHASWSGGHHLGSMLNMAHCLTTYMNPGGPGLISVPVSSRCPERGHRCLLGASLLSHRERVSRTEGR